MPVPLYFDVHVWRALADELRLRGVDVLLAVDDGFDGRPDDEVLARATALGRLVFTRDIGFKAMAEVWQREGRFFGGLAFGAQNRGSIGVYLRDLELLAKASSPEETANVVFYLPF